MFFSPKTIFFLKNPYKVIYSKNSPQRTVFRRQSARLVFGSFLCFLTCFRLSFQIFFWIARFFNKVFVGFDGFAEFAAWKFWVSNVSSFIYSLSLLRAPSTTPNSKYRNFFKGEISISLKLKTSKSKLTFETIYAFQV